MNYFQLAFNTFDALLSFVYIYTHERQTKITHKVILTVIYIPNVQKLSNIDSIKSPTRSEGDNLSYQFHFSSNTPLSKILSQYPSSNNTNNNNHKMTTETNNTLTVPEGTGTAIGDIEVIAWYIEKVPETHDLLKAVHCLFFDSEGTKSDRKEKLKQFKGFPAETGREDKLKDALSNPPWSLPCLKDLCQFFDLDSKNGDKVQLVERCVKFLMVPVATKRTTVEQLEKSRKPKVIKKPASNARKSSPSKKRKQSSNSKKKSSSSSGSKSSKKKRKSSSNGTPSDAKKARPAVVIYATAQKAELKANNPTLDKKGLGALVLGNWRKLTPEERKIWEDKAAAEKLAIEEENAVMGLF